MNSLTALSALSQVINHDTNPHLVRLARVNGSQVRIIKKFKKAKFNALREVYRGRAGLCLEMCYIDVGLITIREYSNMVYKRIKDRQRLNYLFGYLGYTHPSLPTNRTLQRAQDLINGKLGEWEHREEAEELAKKLDMSLIDIYNWSMSNDPEWADRTKQEQYERERRHYEGHRQQMESYRRPWGWFRERD